MRVSTASEDFSAASTCASASGMRSCEMRYTAASSLSSAERVFFAASVSRNRRHVPARALFAIEADPPRECVRALTIGQYSRCSNTSSRSGSTVRSDDLNAGPKRPARAFRVSRRDSASLMRFSSYAPSHSSPASHKGRQYTPRESSTSRTFRAKSPSTNRQPTFARSRPERFSFLRYSSTLASSAFCETYRQLVVSRFDDSATTLQVKLSPAPIFSPRSTAATPAVNPNPFSARGK